MRSPLTNAAARCAMCLPMMVLVAACSESAGAPEGGRDDAPRPEISARPLILDDSAGGVRYRTIATGLEVPWDVAFAGDGHAFITERPGTIRVLEGDSLRPDAWASFDVFARDPEWNPESGLMGIAVAPDFAESRHVYVIGTFPVARSGAAGLADRVRRLLTGAAPTRYVNRVYRLTDRDGVGSQPELLIDDLPAAPYHAGGALDFGPDGMLWLTIGDTFAPESTQVAGSLRGAILRYRPDGSIPADNPDPRSPVFAQGFRNPQALAWGEDGTLYAIDHGPSGLPHESGRSGMDELNVVRAGADYGWPHVSGVDTSDAYVDPIALWSPAIAPAGMAYYPTGPLPFEGDLIVGGLRGWQVRLIDVSRGPDGVAVTSDEPILEREFGRIRAVVRGPDGLVYLATSNRDGRGVPGAGDDRIIRVEPFGAE